MNDKITIIEGPTPTFETVAQEWGDSQCECPHSYHIMMTVLRTLNGPLLMERCRRAWAADDVMYLHFRNTIGLEARVPIIAADYQESPEGPQIVVWVRMDDHQLTQGYVVSGDDDNDDEDEEE